MLLKNNVIIHDEEAPPILKGPTPATGMGIVYVANATPKLISSITVGGVALPTVPAPSPLGQPPNLVPVNRYGSPPVFNSGAQLVVNFDNTRSYQTPILIDEDPDNSLTLWLFYTGIVLTGPNGTIRQLAWGIGGGPQLR
ncbi:MAG TPA: hypothetical protein VGJ51_18505 [Candidatus Angelobacter sp.]